MRAIRRSTALALALGASCAEPDVGAVLTFPGSLLGAEGEVLRRQIERFEERYPEVEVELLETPDAADERRTLYVQWLNAKVGDPDVLQIDVVWTPELAAAGWILPLDERALDVADVLPAALEAARHEGVLFAMPWFVDVGMLYWRTDLLERAPETLDELADAALAARHDHGLPYGLAWQGARYEGLVATFVEILGAFGGSILDAEGEVAVDSEAAVRALAWMRSAVERGVVPAESLTWREEHARLAFQGGRAAMMRNWPYAWPLLEEAGLAGRVAVAPMPRGPAGSGGEATACLGGQHLAVNARTEHPEAARALVAFLTAPEQMLERARMTGQLPPRVSLYSDPALADALAIPPDQALAVVRRARPRPVTPAYAELSQALQAPLSRALSGQVEPRAALAAAAADMRAVIARRRAPPEAVGGAGVVALGLAAVVAVALARRRRRGPGRPDREPGESRAALALGAPALAVVAAVAAFPLAWTAWESLHRHDLRAGGARAYVGLGNYAEALRSPRFQEALAHTAGFTAVTVALELAAGLALALALDRAFRGRGLARAAALLPWALPTVVAALVWRFLFEGSASLANRALVGAGLLDEPLVWLGGAWSAWVPIVLADVWKTTPFVTLLLAAGLAGVDRDLADAARIDGAGAWRRLVHVVLPALRPTLCVVLLFRTLDAIRVFDLVYALSGGGPGTATEPVALLAFHELFSSLRFGYGSALALCVLALALAAALAVLRLLGRDLVGGRA